MSNLESIVHNLKVPKIIFNIIMIDYLDLESIKKIIYISKNFVISESNKIFLSNVSKGLTYCCANGYIKEVKWLHNNEINIEKTYLGYPFVECCRNGHFEIAKWLYDIHKNNFDFFTFKHAFTSSSSEGHLKIAQWLYSLTKHSDRFYDLLRQVNYALTSSCQKGFTKVTSWLYSLYESHNYEIDKTQFFINNYKNGNLICAEWLYERNGLDDSFDYNGRFIGLILRGEFEIAKWLYELTKNKINVHAENESALIISCSSGNLEFSKWIYNLDKDHFKLDANNYSMFTKSCINGHFEIFKWLNQIKSNELSTSSLDNKISCLSNKMDIQKTKKFIFCMAHRNSKINPDVNFINSMYEYDPNSKEEKIKSGSENSPNFDSSIMYGHIKVAKLLHELCSLETHKCSRYIFCWACRLECVEIAIMLYTIKNCDYPYLEQDKIYLYYKKNILEWMIKLFSN